MMIRNIIITVVALMLLVCTFTSCTSTSSKTIGKQIITIKLECISPVGFKQTDTWALTPERTFFLKHGDGKDSTEFRIMNVQDSPLIAGFERDKAIGKNAEVTVRWKGEGKDRITANCELLDIKFLD